MADEDSTSDTLFMEMLRRQEEGFKKTVLIGGTFLLFALFANAVNIGTAKDAHVSILFFSGEIYSGIAFRLTLLLVVMACYLTFCFFALTTTAKIGSITTYFAERGSAMAREMNSYFEWQKAQLGPVNRLELAFGLCVFVGMTVIAIITVCTFLYSLFI